MQGGHGGYYGGGGSPPQGYGYGYGGYGHDTGYYPNIYPPSVPGAAYDDPLARHKTHDEIPAPTNELQFQPSETCPKNYVIYDQTCTKSRVMYHPSLAHKFGGAPEYVHETGKGTYLDKDYEDSCSVRHKEDTDEIDALLSSEDGEEDDMVSTGRTPGYQDGSSPDSCSSSYGKSMAECTAGGGRKKKERMKKMVRTLKGIIPGGNQMDTPAVLDEAVKYLKSLKVEVKKLGVRGSDS